MTHLDSLASHAEPGSPVPTEMPPPVMPPVPEAAPEIIELPTAEPILPVRDPGKVVPVQA